MSLRKGLLLSLLALCVLPAPASASGPPDADIFGLQSLNSTSVEVLGRINPAGTETQYRVQYDVASSQWCQSDGATGTPASQTSNETLSQTDNTYFVVLIELDSLTSGTSYCARITATNAAGSDFGSMVRFTAGAPAVQTFGGMSTGAASGRVLGTVNPVGSPTQYWARYAPGSSEWCQTAGASGTPTDATTPQSVAVANNNSQSVTVDITGLLPETEYCAQLVASNAAGTGSADHASFTTDVAPPCGATWNGGTGDWTAANWTFTAPATDGNGDGRPDVDDKVCIPAGVVNLTSAQIVAGLRVTGTGGLDLAGDLTLDDPAAATANDGSAVVESGATIQLTSTAAVGSSLSGGSLTNGGTVRTVAGWGGTRTLSFGTIANTGGATLESDTATTVEADTFTNSGTINANGALATNQHTTLATAAHDFHQNAGTIAGTGALVLRDGTYHQNGGTVGPSAVFTSAESLDLDGGGTATVNVFDGRSGLVSNVAAAVTVKAVGGVGGQGATLGLDGNVTNAGTIVLTNHSAGDGGTANLDPGGQSLTNTGTFRTAAVGGGNAGTRSWSDEGTLVNAAAGTVEVEHATSFGGPLTNAGTVDVAAGVTATMSGADLVQTAGTTTVNGDLALAGGQLDLQGGTLAGDGQVSGSVQNGGGTVSPGGAAPGELAVSGSYGQGANGTLRIDVDGTTAHDRLAVDGTASLGGTLAIDGAGYTPASSDQFTFVTSTGAASGTFATRTGTSAGGGRTYAVAYAPGTPGSARLVVVAQHALTVSKGGSGFGDVSSNVPGITCGADCGEAYDEGTAVTLTATAAAGSRFEDWTGAGTESCSGTTCQVTLDQARSVGVVFVQLRGLSVVKSGSGSGTVTSDVAGIDCGNDCSQDYDEGTTITLSAAPAAGSRFTGWSGAGCSGTGTCQVTLNAARTVTATFVQQRTLSVAKTGTGSGTVSGSGIDCGTDCNETYDQDTVVTLTATAAAGSRFAGWSGAGCSGTGTCQVTMSAARNVTASFARQRTLTVATGGTGSGSVSATGIACGADCDETYDEGTVVVLTATPAAGSRAGGWSGAGTEACTGTTCAVTMSAARDVTATFVQQRAAAVSKAGNGSGTVTGAGIDCGSDCSESYDQGAPVTLTAAPAAGSRFTGWSGDCSGTGPCQLTMSQARSVTATFAKIDDDGDGVSPPADCNDGNAGVKPGATDVPDNGTDEDCNGTDAKSPPPTPPTPPTTPTPPGPTPPGPAGATDGNDTLDATGVSETICGLLGDDVINALAGDDTVFGDLCDVKAKLFAAQAAGGNDTIKGGTGNDTLYGAGGADKLLGEDGNDKIFGGGGNDVLDGGKGKDSLDGGAGNDKLTGGADLNTLKGGAGDDTINAKNGKKDTVDCGAGKKDSANLDKADKAKGCEKVKRARK